MKAGGEASDIASEYAEKVKKDRIKKNQNQSSASSMQQKNRAELAKKEAMKQKLTEQYSDLKKQNKTLNLKLQKTEKEVQAFIEEMG